MTTRKKPAAPKSSPRAKARPAAAIEEEDGEVRTAVLQMLTDEKVPFTRSGDVIGFGARGDNGEWTCFVRVDDETRVVAFYSLSPLSADAEHLTAVAELISRANFGLPLGNFEIDLDDGEIRVKTSVDLEGTAPAANLLKRLLYANVTAMDLYLPAIAAVLDGHAPADALALAEQSG